MPRIYSKQQKIAVILFSFSFLLFYTRTFNVPEKSYTVLIFGNYEYPRGFSSHFHTVQERKFPLSWCNTNN